MKGSHASDQERALKEALLYLADCTLATVSAMAMKKSKSKHEFERQISIAQKACDWIRDLGIDPSGTRAADIVRQQSVKEWASKYC